MKFYVLVDEWYPVYDLSSDDMWGYKHPIELSEEEYARFQAALEEFNEVQIMIENNLPQKEE